MTAPDSWTDDECRNLISSIPVYVWSALPDGAVDFVNHQWKQFTGLPASAALGWKWRSVVHPEDVERFTSAWRSALRTLEPLEQEIRVRRHDRSYRWWLIRCTPQFNNCGKVLRWYGSGFDIDDRKRAQDEIRRHNDTNRDRIEKELRDLIDTIPVLCGRLSSDGSVDFFNQRTLDYYGLQSEQMIGFRWRDWVHPEDLPRLLSVLGEAFSTGQSVDIETRNKRANGEYRWLMHRIVPEYDERGEIIKWYGTSVDIEDRKRAEQAVLEQRVLERTRIARELHDTVLQNFQATLLMLGTAKSLLGPGPIKERFEQNLRDADRALVEVREAIQGLRLRPEEPDNLVTALSSFGQELAAACGIAEAPTFRVEVSGLPTCLPPSVRHEIFSVGSEALRNAFHHACAKHIHVQFLYEAEEFILAVIDDGKGFDPSFLSRYPEEKHFGFAGMRERARLVRGEFILRSELGMGSRIELRIPAVHAYAASSFTAVMPIHKFKLGS